MTITLNIEYAITIRNLNIFWFIFTFTSLSFASGSCPFFESVPDRFLFYYTSRPMQTRNLRQLAFPADAPRSVGQPEGFPPAAAEAYLTIVREWLSGEPKEPGISRLHDPDRGASLPPLILLYNSLFFCQTYHIAH